MPNTDPISCRPFNATLVAEPPTLDPSSPMLTVSFGQSTFDAEGLEAPGRFFSRALHWPGGASGVTIGRGYDMGGRTRNQIERELASAGLDSLSSAFLSRAAGLRGQAAADFFRREKEGAPVLSLDVQNALYERVTVPETVRDIQRIFSKPDTVSEYGAVSWSDLPRTVQELVFDLRYRGDYTPGTREVIQPLLVSRDWDGLRKAMQDTTYWEGRGVPANRIRSRASLAENL